MSLLDLQNQLLNRGEDFSNNNFNTLYVGVNAIRLIERGLGSNAVQKKGIEQRAMGRCLFWKNSIKLSLIVRPEIGWCPHPGKQHRDFLGLQIFKNAHQCAFGLRRIQPTQCIIGTKLDDDRVNWLTQGPVQPRFALRNRITRYTRIDHNHIMPFGLERRLKPNRKGLQWFKSIASGQAVAQCKNAYRFRRKRLNEQNHGKQSDGNPDHDSPNGTGNRNLQAMLDIHPKDRHLSQTVTTAIALNAVDLTLPSRAGDVHILKNVNFTAEPGEAIGIVGPSGSGKTSLLMVIAGLEPITKGAITVAGHTLHDKREDQLAKFRRDNIGIVFQSFHLIPTLTAIENVAVPLEFRGDRNAASRAREGLERVGLAHRLTHYPGQLSGGEQQRVAIARALASGARILLADEPTGNLDQETGSAIIKLLFDLKTREGATLLLVTHDDSLASQCDRMIRVRDGHVAA